MKREFDYKPSDREGDMNSYDIFEIGGGTVAFSVKWEFVEPIIKSLNSLYNSGRSFILELIEKEEILKSKLSENLDLYKSKDLMVEYDKTFSQWNKSNLVLWDLKDILCRMDDDLY